MITCETCKRKNCEKNGKPCKKIELLMKDEGILSRDYIRPRISAHKRGLGDGSPCREIPMSQLEGFDNDLKYSVEQPEIEE